METLKIVFFCSVFVSASTGIGLVSAGHLVSEVIDDSPTTIRTCLEQDVLLSVDSLQPSVASSDTVVLIVEWIKDEAVLAVNVSGHFIPLTDLGKRLKYVPEQGVQLPDVRQADLGTYRVRVHSEQQGVMHVYEHTVHLVQQKELVWPLTEPQVYIGDDVIFDKSTGQWHLQLLCGRFFRDNVTSVTWETPSKRRLANTRSDRGNFVLHAPNPLEDGYYTCFVHTTRCLDKHVTHELMGRVQVHRVEQHLRILDASYRALQDSCSGGMVRDGDYFLAFRLTPAIGKSAYDTYVAKGYHDDDPLIRSLMPEGCLSVDGSLPCDRHYRSKILDLWDHLNVVEVRLMAYKHREIAAFFEFNATGHDYIGWMRKDTVTRTNYEDFFEEPQNFVSIEGDFNRKFYINRNYGGCVQDAGWLVVSDGEDPCSNEWAPPSPYPVISYTEDNTHYLWTSSSVRHADVLAVWVKFAHNVR